MRFAFVLVLLLLSYAFALEQSVNTEQSVSTEQSVNAEQSVSTEQSVNAEQTINAKLRAALKALLEEDDDTATINCSVFKTHGRTGIWTDCCYNCNGKKKVSEVGHS